MLSEPAIVLHDEARDNARAPRPASRFEPVRGSPRRTVIACSASLRILGADGAPQENRRDGGRRNPQGAGTRGPLGAHSGCRRGVTPSRGARSRSARAAVHSRPSRARAARAAPSGGGPRRSRPSCIQTARAPIAIRPRRPCAAGGVTERRKISTTSTARGRPSSPVRLGSQRSRRGSARRARVRVDRGRSGLPRRCSSTRDSRWLFAVRGAGEHPTTAHVRREREQVAIVSSRGRAAAEWTEDKGRAGVPPPRETGPGRRRGEEYGGAGGRGQFRSGRYAPAALEAAAVRQGQAPR